MELPFPIDAAVSESLYRALAEVELNRYPEARPKAIRNLLLSQNRLANKVDVVLGNGSDELIHLFRIGCAASSLHHLSHKEAH